MHSVIGLMSIALLGSVAIAQTTTSLFLLGFGYDAQPLVASIKGSHDSTTTYSVHCPSGADSYCAGLGFDYVQGPSTMQMFVTESQLSVSLGCSLAKSSADCTETIAGSAANYPGLSSTVITGTDFSSGFVAVTITAGNGAVSASTGAAATAPTVSATTTTAAAPTTTAAWTGSQTVSNAAASTRASSSSTGGVPQITGNAHWAIGGVAAAVALAAL